MMMACLFLVAGLVMYKNRGHAIDDFKGVFRTMPITALLFTVGALSAIGVPPTCGFFSKWYLLLGSINAGQWAFVTALLVSTLINVALFFRVFDKCFFVHGHTGAAVDREVRKPTRGPEAPLSMLIPAVVTALAILLIGVFNQVVVNEVINFAVPAGL
jgi:multicomponent Na+:H+ antiporter subunit D